MDYSKTNEITMKKDFEKWFIRVIDMSLFMSLEQWQIARVKELAWKAYKKSNPTTKP